MRFPGDASGKAPVSAGTVRDVGFIPGSERSRQEKMAVQYSCQENLRDRGT